MPRSQIIILTPIIPDTIHTATIPDTIIPDTVHPATIPDTITAIAHILLIQGPMVILVLTVILAMAHTMAALTAVLTEATTAAVPMEAMEATTAAVPMEAMAVLMAAVPVAALVVVMEAITAAAPMEAMAVLMEAMEVLTEATVEYMEFLLTVVFIAAYMQAVHTAHMAAA
jgi:hypothetical protein